MSVETTSQPNRDRVRQFSVFTANRMGQLHELVGLLGAQNVHVLALTVLDSTDTAVIRLVVDDPEKARSLLVHHGVPFTEHEVVVVEFSSAAEFTKLVTTLLEAETNINYLYSFIPHPREKSLLAMSMEDNDIAETVLARHQFRVLKQADVSR